MPPALSIVRPQIDPWGQREDEPDDDFQRFVRWLFNPRRAEGGAHAPPSLAEEFDWAQRALAYDRALALPADRTDLSSGLRDLVDCTLVEIAKLRRRVLGTSDSSVPLSDLLRMTALLIEMNLAHPELFKGRTDFDFENLGADDLAAVRKAHEILRHAMKGSGHAKR